MRKFLLLLGVLASIESASGQLTAMPSSSALQSTRYSGASVSENTGRMTASVPLYNYGAGGISVPVSLTYVGNGVKVIQPSNWVGTNWLLNAGGVVTRIVNDYPDELATLRIKASTIDSAAVANGETMPFIDYYQTKDSTDTRDLRADLFSFSFPGYSGSFYLDDQMVPRLLDNGSELKISLTPDGTPQQTWTIKIVTPDGTSYFFGGSDASEKSSTAVQVGKVRTQLWMNQPQLIGNQPVTPLCTTAFYLYKIVDARENKVFFEYHSALPRNVIFYEQQSRTGTDRVISSVDVECYDFEKYQEVKSSVFFGTLYDVKRLKRIFSPNSLFELRFNSDNYQLPSDGYLPTLQYDDRILNDIEEVRVYPDSSYNFVTKRVTLDYLKPESTNSLKHRFFLERVHFFHALSAKTTNPTEDACETYKFEYDHPEVLPSRFSYKVDMLGYFNGLANLSLIPDNLNIVFEGVFQDLAIRESNFESAKKGSLTKIQTPTKGYTKFEYEAPLVRAISPKEQFLRVYRNTNETPSSNLESTFAIGGPIFIGDSMEPTLVVPENQTMAVVVTAQVLSGASHHGTTVTVVVDDLTDNQFDDTQSFQLIHGKFAYSETLLFELKKGHKYTMKLQMSAGSSSTSVVEAWGRFMYRGYEFFPAQGIRIKTVKDYADGQIAKTTRYHYKKAENVGTIEDDSAVLLNNGDAQERSEAYSCQSEDVPESFQVASITTNPFANIFAGSDNQAEYRYVTLSFGGDDFEEGGLEKQFRIEEKEKILVVSPHRPGPLPDPNSEKIRLASIELDRKVIIYGGNNLNNDDGNNGTLIGERIIERKGIRLFVNSETNYDYTKTVDHVQRSILISVPEEIGVVQTMPATGTYTQKSIRFDLTKVESKQYPDPYLLAAGSEGLNPLKTVTTYTYGSLRGIPTTVTSKNSNGKNRVSKSYYPSTADIAALTPVPLSSDVLNYQGLRDQNILDTPIQTESFIQDNDGAPTQLLSRSRTYFTQVAGSSPVPMVLPLSRKSAKAGEALIGFGSVSQYDAGGRPVEITEPNGLVKSIVYGYGGDVVMAELSNQSYSALSSTTIANLQAASIDIQDDASLATFETQLNTLRSAHPAAMVTTYLYRPDGRLDSVTDIRGRKTSKKYDECGRLIYVLDNEGNVLEETNYNIKN